jgi:hypothetical protein
LGNSSYDDICLEFLIQNSDTWHEMADDPLWHVSCNEKVQAKFYGLECIVQPNKVDFSWCFCLVCPLKSWVEGQVRRSICYMYGCR